MASSSPETEKKYNSIELDLEHAKRDKKILSKMYVFNFKADIVSAIKNNQAQKSNLFGNPKCQSNYLKRYFYCEIHEKVYSKYPKNTLIKYSFNTPCAMKTLSTSLGNTINGRAAMNPSSFS